MQNRNVQLKIKVLIFAGSSNTRDKYVVCLILYAFNSLGPIFIDYSNKVLDNKYKITIVKDTFKLYHLVVILFVLYSQQNLRVITQVIFQLYFADI